MPVNDPKGCDRAFDRQKIVWGSNEAVGYASEHRDSTTIARRGLWRQWFRQDYIDRWDGAGFWARANSAYMS